MKRILCVMGVVFSVMTGFACVPKEPAGPATLSPEQMKVAAYYASAQKAQASEVSGKKRACSDMNDTMEETMIIGRSLQKTFNIDQIKLEQLTKLQSQRGQKLTELGLFYNDLAIYKVDADAAQKKAEFDYAQLMKDYETLNPEPALAGGKDIVNRDIEPPVDLGWKYHYDEISKPYKSRSALLQEADALSEEYTPGPDVKMAAADSSRPKSRFDADEEFEARTDSGRKYHEEDIEEEEMYADEDEEEYSEPPRRTPPKPAVKPQAQSKPKPKAAAPAVKSSAKYSVRILSGYYSADGMAKSLKAQGENVTSFAAGQKVDMTQIIYKPTAVAHAKAFQSKYFRHKSKLVAGQSSQGADLILILGNNLNK